MTQNLMTGPFLPYGRQTIEDDDIAAVTAALRSDLLTTGPRVEEFERAFGKAVGADHVVACNSGTAALHLAALALDLKPDEAAVVPSMTFLSTANAVRMTGAEVMFADVDPDSGLLTADTLEAAIDRGAAAGRKITAAFPVHLNGQVCDMTGLAAVAAHRGVRLVEDACHALGVADVGSCRNSFAACFSTHPVKAIATGEGGVTATADPAAAARMRRLRSHGMVRQAALFENRDYAFDGDVVNPWYYELQEVGWNYRMPDVLCALGLSQLRKLARFQSRRREIAAQYDQLLSKLNPAISPVPHGNLPHGWHLYAILVNFPAVGTTRRRFMQALSAEGIGAQVHYIPVHQQPYYRRRYGALSLPGVEAYYARCLSIPFYPAMTDDDIHRVVDVLSRLVVGGTAA